MSENYFKTLSAVKVETEKKGRFSYASWSDAWKAVKDIDPDADYVWHENANGTLGFFDEGGVFAKVSVVIFGHTHTAWLPVMDHNNKAIKPEQVDASHVNKAYQRCFVKAIAMHGLGLYVYRGEDFPDAEQDAPAQPRKKADAPKKREDPSHRVANELAALGFDDPVIMKNLIECIVVRDLSKSKLTEAEARDVSSVLSTAVMLAKDEVVAFLSQVQAWGLTIETAGKVGAAWAQFTKAPVEAETEEAPTLL